MTTRGDYTPAWVRAFPTCRSTGSRRQTGTESLMATESRPAQFWRVASRISLGTIGGVNGGRRAPRIAFAEHSQDHREGRAPFQPLWYGPGQISAGLENLIGRFLKFAIFRLNSARHAR
jgi:hypothetical protein